MDEDEEERLEDIISNIQGDVTEDKKVEEDIGGDTRSYKEYKEEEKDEI